MAVIVELGAALICFLGQCYPALVGQATPPGEYQIQHRQTTQLGYGGDILVFKVDGHQVYAIHRIINFEPSQKRKERIKSEYVSQRIITDGCINVSAAVYQNLVKCCSKDVLVVVK